MVDGDAREMALRAAEERANAVSDGLILPFAGFGTVGRVIGKMGRG